MPLIDQVTKDMAQAMKAQDQARLAPLRMLKAAIMNREVEKGRGLEPTEDMQVVQQQVKQRKDSIELFEQGGRHELVAKERAEIVVLETYLPAAVPEEEIAAAIAAAKAETGASSPKDMGKVMKLLTAKFAGRPVDGKALSERVRQSLSQPAAG